MEIETMKRLRLKKGDVVILKCKNQPTKQAYQAIRDQWADLKKRMGIDFSLPIVLLENGMDIEVLGKE